MSTLTRLPLLLLLLLASTLARAADTLLISDHTDRLNLLPYLEYLPDSAHTLSFDDARRNADRWRDAPRHRESLNFGYTDDVYWFRFKVKNTANSTQSANIEIGYTVLDNVDVYVEQADRETLLYELGDKHPFHDRLVEHRNFVVPLNLEANSAATYYLRIQTTSSMQVPLFLWRDASLLKNSQAEMLGLGIYFGTMGVMVLYNLFVFFSVRESNYLYYVLYVASVSLFFASLSGISFQYLWPNNTWWNDQSIVFFLACVVLFAALFTIRFLRIEETFPRLHHVGTAVVLISALIAASTLLFDYRTMIAVVITWAIIGITLALGVGMYRWVLGDSSAKYYCISWFTFLIGGIILALNKFDVIPRNFLTENATQFGSAMEVILLSFALADRLNIEKRRRFEAQLHALENERVARLAQAEALQQEKNARKAQEQALVHEREAREAQAAALAVQRQATETLEHKVRERTHELEIANQRLEELTYTDGLTGIRNRRYLNRALEREFSRARREKSPVATLLIDIDHFKQFNDTHGHLVGDDCLREVAQTIQQCALRENDVVARYGGEEFCILLPNTDQPGAMRVADQVCEAIRDILFDVEGQRVMITASIGVTSCIPERHQDVDRFIAAADSALYASKANGRNQVNFALPNFSSPLNQHNG
ncbi:diguanylate cyclase [Ketobacter sp.]|uniref:sensor domain-containing diguanylate cyclase n=1 Tax=Ketobacter sp. TaxID=2083498 RepID=UPI000F15523F|nr:diguanylate cyclase [Ketobacter sp.]RLT93784.1 MAG: GGDEF domain-containing protein [Ketobacter sp.]